MSRYLMTHSLLSSWLYAMKGNPYEDSTTEKDSFAEFMTTLRREPTPTTEAMQNGIDFEVLVTAIVNNDFDAMQRYDDKWLDAANVIADVVSGGVLQYRAKKEVVVSGITFLLYGRLDCLKAGVVYDIKFSKSYEKGKYVDSTQHPAYLELIPLANQFTYLVSNGSMVWRETYRRDETPAIEPIIADFVSWLEANELLDLYKEKWVAA